MKLSSFLSIVATVAILFGIAFVVMPRVLLAQYGVIVADSHVIIMSRFFGSALINLGLLLWLARNVADSQTRQAIVLAGLVGNIIGLLVALHGQMQGLVNSLGWSTVVIYAVFTIGFAYFQFASKARTAAISAPK